MIFTISRLGRGLLKEAGQAVVIIAGKHDIAAGGAEIHPPALSIPFAFLQQTGVWLEAAFLPVSYTHLTADLLTTQDGERGLPLPLSVEVLPCALKVFIRDPESQPPALRRLPPEVVGLNMFRGNEFRER